MIKIPRADRKQSTDGFPKEALEWWSSAPAERTGLVDYDLNNHHIAAEQIVTANKNTRATMAQGAGAHVRFMNAQMAFELEGGDGEAAHLIIYACSGRATLRTLRARKVEIILSHEVELIDCTIDHLVIANGAGTLNRCWVRQLDIQHPVSALRVERGGVLTFPRLATPQAKNPFTGPVDFVHVVLPVVADGASDNEQAYRNLRAHLTKLENTRGAALFHVLEQSIERRKEPDRFNRALSWIYDITCRYGSSSARPFGLFIALASLVWLLIFCMDGAAVTKDADSNSWVSALAGCSWLDQAMRAALLVLQSMLNPLGLFTQKTAFVARTGTVAAILGIYSLFSTMLAALFLIAVRRRFKMTSSSGG